MSGRSNRFKHCRFDCEFGNFVFHKNKPIFRRLALSRFEPVHINDAGMNKNSMVHGRIFGLNTI